MITLTKDILAATAVTHGGTFHADDVFATVILGKALGEIVLCRTLKLEGILPSETIVFDIGGGAFDHHQLGGNGTRENGVPYASVGLIWRHFGPKILGETEEAKLVWELVDRNLIQGIDAIDNGAVPKSDFPAQIMSVSGVIGGFNPVWDGDQSEDEAFLRALGVAEVIFDNVLNKAKSKARAKATVDAAIERAEGHILVLEKFVPWKEFVLMADSPKAKEIWFVVFPSNRGGFNWQCVPDELDSFGQRKSVPEAWKGLAEEELRAVTGVKTATFCHASGFIGAAETLKDAIKLAKMAVES